jgi:hypothetical protein
VEDAGEERSGVYDCGGGSKGDDEDEDLVAEFGREGEEGGCALHVGGRRVRDLCSCSEAICDIGCVSVGWRWRGS